MAAKHNFVDPDLAPRSKQGAETNLALGTWTQAEREEMNERFVAAMQAAGHAATTPSTIAGTRNPISGYPCGGGYRNLFSHGKN
jgi:hypothetical protein